MDAILLALISAVLFGAMPVGVRFAFATPLPAATATLLMQLAMFSILGVAALVEGGVTLHGVLPFVAAGVIAPGLSQLCVTLAIRDAGSSRASVAFGIAPLFAIALAVSVFGEEPGAGVLVGALLIVLGGAALAAERDRPAHVRRLGIALAILGAALFAVRDNLVRHLSLETDVPAMTGGAASLAAAIAVSLAVVIVRRHTLRPAAAVAARWFVPGALAGLSYVALFAAFYRGEVSVVASLVATESLWGVVFSALLLQRTERVGPRLVLGAVLVVCGGALIGAFR